MIHRSSRLLLEAKGGNFQVTCERSEAYPILIASPFGPELDNLFTGIRDSLDCGSVHVVMDLLARGTADQVAAAAEAAGLEVLGRTVLNGAEVGKSEAAVTGLWSELSAAGTLRRTVIVGIGGGVVCDVVGFVAATYMRGVPYVLVPTTLMAQVDAAIGGKTGFNHGGQKNLVGGFAHPSGVVIDPALLADLPDRVLAGGVAEIAKVGIIGHPALFAALERSTFDDLRYDRDRAHEIVRIAIAEKLRHLATDPVEVADLRRVLNFGHCVGHAVEAEVGYTWLHGECVAVGIAVATRVSLALGLVQPSEAARIHDLLEQYQLPQHVPADFIDRVWGHLGRISRVRNGPLHLVVPREVGRVEVLTDWPEDVSWEEVC